MDKVLIVLIFFVFLLVGSLANASEVCFQKYPDLCVESLTYSDHFSKSIRPGDKLSGAWVVFCMNQKIFGDDTKYKVNFMYKMPVCYGPDADQGTRACNSGLFSRFEPLSGGQCMKQYLFLQAGEYRWSVLASKNYGEQSTNLVLPKSKIVSVK